MSKVACLVVGLLFVLLFLTTVASATDRDGDGIDDSVDNCPAVFERSCGGYGIVYDCEGCRALNPIMPPYDYCFACCAYIFANPDQNDSDHDGVGDVCDYCPDTPAGTVANKLGCKSCEDSDGGINFNVPGSTGQPLPFIPSHDSCDGNILTEYYCFNNMVDHVTHDCSSDGPHWICDSSLLTGGKCCQDSDGDGVCNDDDNCASHHNSDQTDSDSDGYGDACDNCITVSNPTQSDIDGDNSGDACDPEIDSDGCLNEIDKNPMVYSSDKDSDYIHDDCDNCIDVPNRGQDDSDGDGVGDVCDSCRLVYNPDQNDADGDGIADACDNCPGTPNPDQYDINRDETGDTCDCHDNFMGPGEIGADCGGICSPCPAAHKIPLNYLSPDDPTISPACLPAFTSGDSDGKIDIVFAITSDYHGNYTDYRNDIRTEIRNAYLVDGVLNKSMNKFNFWYLTNLTAGFTIKSNGQCSWSTPSIPIFVYYPAQPPLPSGRYVTLSWSDICPMGNDVAILHRTYCRDYRLGSGFSGWTGDPGVLLHESGHALFGLADEYDDSKSNPPCGTSYSVSSPYPNIYKSQVTCTAQTANPTSSCNYFTTCRNGRWRGTTDNTIMDTCYTPGTCSWGLDAVQRINYVLNQYKDPPYDENRKAIVGYFGYDGTSVVLYSTNIVYGDSPERVIDWNSLKILSKDPTGKILGSFTIDDPRYVDYVNPPGGELLSKANFTLVLPFKDNIQSLEVQDIPSGGKTIGRFDLSIAVDTFCLDHTNDPQCATYDSDNDGVPDLVDKCKSTSLPEVFSGGLLPNHYGDVDGDRIFEVKASSKGNPLMDSTYTLKKTYGCSCLQILDIKRGGDQGEKKFGCTHGTLDDFIKKNGPTTKPTYTTTPKKR